MIEELPVSDRMDMPWFRENCFKSKAVANLKLLSCNYVQTSISWNVQHTLEKDIQEFS
jgi:hypothetical protein